MSDTPIADQTAAQLEREAEVAALIERAADPADDYDGHHGNDTSDRS